jgi:hypothetical protein
LFVSRSFDRLRFPALDIFQIEANCQVKARNAKETTWLTGAVLRAFDSTLPQRLFRWSGKTTEPYPAEFAASSRKCPAPA